MRQLTVKDLPFPWFGGKSAAAPHVWPRFGNVLNYVEPFAGSAAMLLLRPGGAGKIETINDLDGYVSNFWRAVKLDPAAVVDAADWIVSERDLYARHAWLRTEGVRRLALLADDPEGFDARVAGWWLWGINLWIGSGWCRKSGQHLPYLTGYGRGIFRVPGRGCRREYIEGMISALSARLRDVRITCGSWKRLTGNSVLGFVGTSPINDRGALPVGVFLDPPYDHRMQGLRYLEDGNATISAEVREWAIQIGENPFVRVALCGLVGEHTLPATWEVVELRKVRGEGHGNATGKVARELVWFSPHCLRVEAAQSSLFGKEG